MIPIVTAEQMRALDHRTITEAHEPSLVLMERVGAGVVTQLEARYGPVAGKSIVILGGDWTCDGITTSSGVTTSSFTPGNNGNRSGTLTLSYTATSAGTRTITVTGNVAAASRSVSFEVTAAAALPAVTTRPASDVTRTCATLLGSVTSNGAATTVGFAHGSSIAYGSTVTASPSPLGASAGETAVSHSLTGLACGTTYHYRVQATNAAGTTNGSDASFTTLPCLPSPTLEYLFNEGAWSGIAGEVRDGSGSAYHGTASCLAGSRPTTATVSPAVAGPKI